jgi:hypothetical protein
MILLAFQPPSAIALLRQLIKVKLRPLIKVKLRPQTTVVSAIKGINVNSNPFKANVLFLLTKICFVLPTIS